MVDISDIPAGEQPNDERGTVADFGKTLAAGTLNLGSNLAAASRYFYDAGKSENGSAISKSIQELLGGTAENITETMNPESKKLLSAGLTSEEFWQHPLLGTALKATGMVPSIAAIAIPGGLLGDVVSASVLAAGAGGAFNAGAVVDEFYKKLDAMPDKELQEQSPYYEALRGSMEEKDARAKFANKSLGFAPAINAIVGAAVGVVGPAGSAARKLAGGNAVLGAGERGAVGSAALGALEGGAGNAIQGGIADTTGQNAELEATLRKEFDATQTGNAVLEGAALGTLFGGVVGAVSGRKPIKRAVKDAVEDAAGETPPKSEELRVAERVATNEPVPQPKEGTTGTPSKPPENPVTVGNPQNAPTRSRRDGGKRTVIIEKKPTVETVQATGPDTAQAAALAANEGPNTIAPTEVAAAQKRIENPAPEVAPEAPAQAPERVVAPPDVAAAQQRIGASQTPAEPSVAAPVDTGANVPETPATLAAQQEQLVTGNRKAVMYPNGTKEPPVPINMSRFKTQRGIFHYDPQQTTRREIIRLSAAGKENELLGLGPVDKAEAVARANAGETPVAVVERTPDGTEVRAAAGTDQTAPAQKAAIEKVASPGNTVTVENPAATVAKRTGRILRPINEIVETAPINVKENLKEGVKLNDEGERIVKGRNMGPKAKAEIEGHTSKAEKIVGAHPEATTEANYISEQPAREAVIARARAMVEAAEKDGVKIPGQIKLSAKGDQLSDNVNIQKLRYAADLVRATKDSTTNKRAREAVERFKEREQAKPEDALAARRAEGDEAKRVAQSDASEQAAADTPESALLAKEGVEAVEREVSARATSDADAPTIRSKVDSSRGTVRGVEDATETRQVKSKSGELVTVEGTKAASEVRKVALSPEMLAKYGAPKKAMLMARIADRAAKNAERNPTPAQIEAGNYAKGHVKIDGLDVTIENARGSLRKGIGENGKPWEVRLPDHYGYIKKTTGADGDHVDAYIGRSGDRIFIADQLDLRTGAFDEHKVMLNYKDLNAAVEAYTKAFSDGNGRARLGDMHEVSMDELKAWLAKGDTKKSATEGLIASISEDPSTVKPVATMTAREAVAKLEFDPMDGAAGKALPFLKNRVAELVGDTDLHFVKSADFAKLDPTLAADGLVGSDIWGMYVPDNKTIYINEKLLGSPTKLAHTVLHEATHRVMSDEIEKSPKTKRAIRAMMEQTREIMDRAGIQGDTMRYALENEHEFMAEAFSNAQLQKLLAMSPVSDKLATYLQLDRKPPSMWSALVYQVRKAVEKIVGPMPGSNSLFDAAMRVGEHILNARRSEMTRAGESIPNIRGHAQEQSRLLVRRATDEVKELLQRPDIGNSPWMLKLRTFDNIAQIADHFWKEGNPIRAVHNAIEATRASADRIFRRSEPVIDRLDKVLRAHPKERDAFTTLLHDATVMDVHPDVPVTDPKNAHLGKNAMKGVQAKARHAEMARRYNELPPALKDAWHESTKYFTDMQNDKTLGVINNRVLKLLGIEDKALGQRIFEGNLTDADRALLGENLQVIEDASELKKINGPYVPLMRRGDYVVKGAYKVDAPSNAKRIHDNEFEFNSRKEAEDFAKAHDLQASMRSVWVDGKTGELYGTDTNGNPIKVLKEDTDSVNKFRVKLQNQYVEYFKTKKEAYRAHAELEKEGKVTLDGVQERKFEPGRAAPEMSTSLSNLAKKLQKTEAYRDSTPTQQATLVQALNEAALASHGSTRVQSKSLPRRNVLGYSKDIVQNTYDYALSSSRYMAKLEHASELEAGLKKMNESIDQDASKNDTFGRRAISNEVLRRVQGDNGFEEAGPMSGVVKRALAVSFIDKLGSPAYSIINAMQPAMVTMPYLAGKHGVGRTFTALGKAYNDINAGQIAKQGLKETARRVKGDAAPDDFITRAKAGLSKEEASMVDEMVRLGVVDPGAGMEIGNILRDKSGVTGKVDSALAYMEGVTREMPRAVESINRLVSSVAAYRLERSRGSNHQTAVQYAQDVVNSTQFNYSPTNSPAVFNHPIAKVALQFKKYGQGMYQLIGTQVGRAMRNAEPGERAQALKTLAGIAATHAAMAGALGLPTEPFKYLVMGANAVGLTNKTWGDVENNFREKAAAVLGKTGGEVVSRGIPRLLGLDLQRMGLDSITSFGEPKTTDEADVKRWLFDNAAGPVAGLASDWVKGIGDLQNGDLSKAAEKLIPLKAASDALRAYRQATEGKKSEAGRETLSPYTPTEAAMRVLGFGNAREAEVGAKRAAYYSASTALKEERSDLVNAWAQASPTSKTKALAAITQWNQQQPEANRIKMKELTDKTKRDAALASKATNGLNASKRDKHILDATNIYNTR